MADHPAPGVDLDRAIAAAQTLLEGAVCACGHYDTDHLYDTGACQGGAAEDNGAGCACPQFCPIAFTVEHRRD